MNIVFEEIKSMKEFNINKPELEVKYLESILTSQFYSKEIKKYFNLLKEIGISEENDEFTKILFEDYDFYNNKDNIDKIPYLNYFTTPNLCTIEDFEYQYRSSMERHPIIEFILKGKENEIISIMNSLPRINLFINKIYNKKVLSITREEAENQAINDLDISNEEINHFNEDISKLPNNYKISNDSKLLDVINIKDNKIYKSYDDIIKLYNKFLTNLTIYNNNKDFLLPLMVQDFSEEISLFNNPEEGINELKKYFLDKNIFEKNQRTFIFSNNVFSDDRNNLLTKIMEEYPQKPVQKNENFSRIGSDDKDSNIRVYHDLQFIIINLQSLLINSGKEKISFEDISEMIEKKYGYEIEESLHIYDIYVDNILDVYEKYEEICFQYFKEILMPEKLTNEKDKAIKDSLSNLELIKDYVISKAAKKYLMRYCLGDYDKKENILKNMKIDKMLLKKDIWEEKIFINPKFKEESDILNNLNIENDNYLDKYFLYNIINEITNEEKENKVDSLETNNKRVENIMIQNISEENKPNDNISETSSKKSEDDRPFVDDNGFNFDDNGDDKPIEDDKSNDDNQQEDNSEG